MSRLAITLGLCLLVVPKCSAREEKPTKLTVVIRGVVTGKDAEALRTSLGKVKGLRMNPDDIQAGEKGQFRHYFSPPFVVEISDTTTAGVGPLAAAVAKTKTPSREEIAPSLNLVLFHPEGSLEEKDIAGLRAALTNVNGVEAQAAGGIGGVPSEGRCWVRLEAAGGADLASILAALRKADLAWKLAPPSR